jgi:hypothetical protein
LDSQENQVPVEFNKGKSYGPLFCRFTLLKGLNNYVPYSRPILRLTSPVGDALTIHFAHKVAGRGELVASDQQMSFNRHGLYTLVLGINRDEARLNPQFDLFVFEEAGKVKKESSKQLRAEPRLLFEQVPEKAQEHTSTDTVPACAACDAMLLRYHQGEHQRDDLSTGTCPYCGAPLAVNWRPGGIVQVQLDTTVKALVFNDHQNEIGIIYHGQPVKLAVKLADLYGIIERYAALFPNAIMGPFIAKIKIWNNLLELDDFTFQPTPPPSDRPATLFPEDLQSF